MLDSIARIVRRLPWPSESGCKIDGHRRADNLFQDDRWSEKCFLLPILFLHPLSGGLGHACNMCGIFLQPVYSKYSINNIFNNYHVDILDNSDYFKEKMAILFPLMITNTGLQKKKKFFAKIPINTLSFQSKSRTAHHIPGKYFLMQIIISSSISV